MEPILKSMGWSRDFLTLTSYSLFRDSKNRIWVGTGQGDTFVVDEKAGTIELLEDVFPSSQGVTYKMIQDDEGRIWFPVFGTGVLIYDPETHVVRKLDNRCECVCPVRETSVSCRILRD
jgi:streptogramin lyase